MTAATNPPDAGRTRWVTMHHGTRLGNVPSIQRFGLRASNGDGPWCSPDMRLAMVYGIRACLIDLAVHGRLKGDYKPLMDDAAVVTFEIKQADVVQGRITGEFRPREGLVITGPACVHTFDPRPHAEPGAAFWRFTATNPVWLMHRLGIDGLRHLARSAELKAKAQQLEAAAKARRAA